MFAQGRLRLLVGALLLCLAAYPVSRWMLRKPPPPPPEATVPVKRTYWKERLKSDIADVEAYVTLGTLEESQGYYTAAVRYLLSARALEGPDSPINATICGPLGRALLALARDKEALPELEKAVQLNPEDLEATLNLAGFYVVHEQPEAASRLLTKFADTQATLPPESLHRLALAQMECGNNAAAKELADRALTQNPDDRNAHSVAARCLLGMGKVKEAKEHLETLVKLVDQEAGVHYLYGLALDQLGEKDAAIEQWKQTVARNPEALDAHEQLGEAFYRQGNYKQAVPHLEFLARRAPNLQTTGRIADTYARLKDLEKNAYWRAVQVGLAGNFPLALQFGKVAAASGDPVVRHKGLQAVAEAYKGLRQKEPFLATMKQLTAGGSVDDLRLMARAYETLDRHEDRTRCLLQAVEKAEEAQKPALLFELAKVYRIRGMRDEAEKTLEQAARLDQSEPALHREMARLYFERRALEGRREKAIAAWQQAIALDPDESSDWQYLGVAYAEAGELAKATAALEHAIDLEPGGGPAYLELGRVYSQMGDKESARRYNALYSRFVAADQKRQILRTRANRPDAGVQDWLAYGDLLMEMGALSEAAQQFERALSKKPDANQVRSKLTAIYTRLRQPERVAALNARAKAGEAKTSGNPGKRL